jgi:hypothetical protein
MAYNPVFAYATITPDKATLFINPNQLDDTKGCFMSSDWGVQIISVRQGYILAPLFTVPSVDGIKH